MNLIIIHFILPVSAHDRSTGSVADKMTYIKFHQTKYFNYAHVALR